MRFTEIFPSRDYNNSRLVNSFDGLISNRLSCGGKACHAHTLNVRQRIHISIQMEKGTS